jgi:hypothetical protein
MRREGSNGSKAGGSESSAEDHDDDHDEMDKGTEMSEEVSEYFIATEEVSEPLLFLVTTAICVCQH